MRFNGSFDTLFRAWCAGAAAVGWAYVPAVGTDIYDRPEFSDLRSDKPQAATLLALLRRMENEAAGLAEEAGLGTQGMRSGTVTYGGWWFMTMDWLTEHSRVSLSHHGRQQWTLEVEGNPERVKDAAKALVLGLIVESAGDMHHAHQRLIAGAAPEEDGAPIHDAWAEYVNGPDSEGEDSDRASRAALEWSWLRLRASTPPEDVAEQLPAVVRPVGGPRRGR